MTGRDRGVRFAGAGRDNEGPLVTSTGAVATVSGDGSVRQAVMLLLTTRPGERLMRPQYGSLLHRLLFAPNDETTAGLAIHYVRQAIRRWEPRVEILDLDAEPDPVLPTRLRIRLHYRVRASLAVESFDLPLDLDPRKPSEVP